MVDSELRDLCDLGECSLKRQASISMGVAQTIEQLPLQTNLGLVSEPRF